MPFKQVFERRVNDAMQQSQAGPAPRSPTPSHSPSFEDHDDDIKKRPLSPRAKSLYEAEDLDLSSKDEKSLPPRFSTLFDTAKPPPTPRVVECCHRESKKRAGVYLSTPVFVLIIVALLFESTLLFAYTVIGLYQNLPSGLLAVTGAPAPVDGCRCEERQGAINFSPNFVFGEKGGEILGQLSVVESMTAIESSPQPSPPTSTTPSPTTSSTTTTTAASTANAAAASHLLSLFSDLDVPPSTSPSPSISIVTATPGVVHSTIIVTSVTGIGGGGAETEAEARPTVTSVRIVDGPATTIQAG